MYVGCGPRRCFVPLPLGYHHRVMATTRIRSSARSSTASEEPSTPIRPPIVRNRSSGSASASTASTSLPSLIAQLECTPTTGRRFANLWDDNHDHDDKVDGVDGAFRPSSTSLKSGPSTPKPTTSALRCPFDMFYEPTLEDNINININVLIF